MKILAGQYEDFSWIFTSETSKNVLYVIYIVYFIVCMLLCYNYMFKHLKHLKMVMWASINENQLEFSIKRVVCGVWN